MPLHISPISRRSFLSHSAAGIASLAVVGQCQGSEAKTNPNFFALLSDTHIPSSPEISARGVNMTANLKQVVQEITALQNKPAGVLINGDCAYLKGLPDDYRNLSECVEPVIKAGLSLHMNMGNHDDRRPFYEALANQRPAQPLVESKHVSMIESPHANWFLLDSLKEVDLVTGELGTAQLEWLEKALDANADKPAIIVGHHNPQFTAPPEGAGWFGLEDTADFFNLIESRQQVKAYVFGHSHNWSLAKRGDLHLINLPPVAYVFAKGKPNGWVRAEVLPEGLHLELKTINPEHPQNERQVKLAWR